MDVVKLLGHQNDVKYQISEKYSGVLYDCGICGVSVLRGKRIWDMGNRPGQHVRAAFYE